MQSTRPPIQMCDALSRNVPKLAAGVEILLANCLANGRRQFVEVAGNFPDQCRYVLEMLGPRTFQGLPEVYYARAAPTLDPVARAEHAEKCFAALGATIRHGGNRAFYSIAADVIQMPPFESFQDANSYYGTLAHECTHWTGSKTRLGRDFGGHRFGSEGYAVEELVAELGAAFLCADLEPWSPELTPATGR